MKVLVVCSGRFVGLFEHKQAFIYESVMALKNEGIEVDIFLLKGRGLLGHLKSFIDFWNTLNKSKYDLIHAYYGLSGLVACSQFSVPVITSFLGSDINLRRIRPISKIVYWFSAFSIFVDKKLAQILKVKDNYVIQPLGVDVEKFFPVEKSFAREKTGFAQSEKVILFASSFDRIEKNYFLAKAALASLKQDFSIIELGKSYSIEYMNLLYNSCDLFLLTSMNEGSPQTIKEAMACNCPIVATDVGDIREVIGGTEGCQITTFNPEDVADKIRQTLNIGKRTNGREHIKHLDSKIMAKKIIDVYKEVLGVE